MFVLIFSCAVIADPVEQGLHLQSVPATPQKVALVIGNSAYRSVQPTLKNPINDATDMARELGLLGFRVLLLRNATLPDMQKKVAEFANLLTHAKVGLVYFAGHGLQSDGVNYLVPVDARLASSSNIPNETLSAQDIFERMANSPTKLNIVILDACRNNPDRDIGVTRNALLTTGLAKPASPLRDGFLAFATAPGQLAADGLGRNGAYTGQLLKFIKKPDLDLPTLFNEVGIAVKAATENRQEPWVEHSPLSERFCFAGCTQPNSQITISVIRNK